MKVPVRVTVGGYKIKIEYVEELLDSDGSPLAGETASYAHHIKINKSKNNTPAKVFSTLLHELMHVSMEITGAAELLGEKKEETVVYGLESMLAPLLTFNKSAAVRYREIEFPWED